MLERVAGTCLCSGDVRGRLYREGGKCGGAYAVGRNRGTCAYGLRWGGGVHRCGGEVHTHRASLVSFLECGLCLRSCPTNTQTSVGRIVLCFTLTTGMHSGHEAVHVVPALRSLSCPVPPLRRGQALIRRWISLQEQGGGVARRGCATAGQTSDSHTDLSP